MMGMHIHSHFKWHPYMPCNICLRHIMKILLTNTFPKKSQPTLGLPPTQGGGGLAEGTGHFRNVCRHSPPGGAYPSH